MTDVTAAPQDSPVETPVTDQGIEGVTADQTTDPAPETTQADTAEHDQEEVKLPKGVQKRIDRLTRERYRLQGELEAMRRQQPEPRPQPQPQGSELKPDDFATYEDYIEARTLERIKREQAQERQQAQQQFAQQREAQAKEQWQQRVEQAGDVYEDFEEVVYGPNAIFSDPMVHALMRSPKGVDVAYYLGKNPKEAARIASMDPFSAAVEIGQLAATVNRPQPKKTTSAPPPINPVGARAAPSKDPSQMTDREFAEWRRKQIAQRR